MRSLLALLALLPGLALAQSQLWEWRGSDGASLAVEKGDVWGLYATFDASNAGVVATRRFSASGSFTCGLSAFPDAGAAPPGGGTWPSTGYRCYRMSRGGSQLFGGINWESSAVVMQACFVLGLLGLGFHGYRSGQLA